MTENDRMTHQRASGIKDGYWSPATKAELVQRLAEYEDTGLEPQEIEALAGTSSRPDEASNAGSASRTSCRPWGSRSLSTVNTPGVKPRWSKAVGISAAGGVCMVPAPSGSPTGCPCPSRPRR